MKSLKRFTTIVSLVLAFAMIFGACDSSSSKKKSRSRDRDDEEEEEEDETEEVEETEETEETEEVVTSEETEETAETNGGVKAIVSADDELVNYYGDILDLVLYYTAQNLDWENDYGSLAGVVEYTSYADSMIDAQETVGYMLKDVNEDDIPELFILAYTGYPYENSYNVLALYSRTEDSFPSLVFEGWTRNQVTLLNDNTFLQDGSGGVASRYLSKFALRQNGELVYIDTYYTDYEDPDDINSDVCWFHDEDGELKNLGYADSFTPDVGFEDYYDMSSEFIPMKDNLHNYQVIMEDCTYDEAVNKCEAMGGHLATIDSDMEAKTIAAYIGYNTEFGQVFMGEPTVYSNNFKDEGDGDIIMAYISGEDGSLILNRTSDDPTADMSGFIGFICETEYAGN